MAVANGAVRDFTYGRALGETAAHSLSVIPLAALILLWAAFLARRWPLADARAGMRVGLVWLALTLAFEFGLGSLRGLGWREMAGEYDVTAGKLWPLIPLLTAIAPEAMRRRARQPERPGST